MGQFFILFLLSFLPVCTLLQELVFEDLGASVFPIQFSANTKQFLFQKKKKNL